MIQNKTKQLIIVGKILIGRQKNFAVSANGTWFIAKFQNWLIHKFFTLFPNIHVVLKRNKITHI